jgi:superfamily I DNA/RNA helicase
VIGGIGLARLAIAKDFLAEYAKLEKSVQASVESAISKFGQHTHAGLHLEKLQDSRDQHVRTIRVDSFWRGVVLAPESGDTYCLITVLPHDKAISYAASHRFSVNQAIGVLEIRDEGALEQLQPALEALAGPSEHRLFAHISDSDLKRLGVDAQVLPIVRLLTSEAHLHALQTILPEIQYTALYALACGMSVQEAWNEVAQHLSGETASQHVDTTDLVAAMERTPGRVAFVSGNDELRAILAYPFDAWRVFLHPSQRRLAQAAAYSGPAQVTGGAGTGKTVTALHRAVYLASQPGAAIDDGTASVLLTSFTRNLVDALAAQLALVPGAEQVLDRIEVINVDRLAYRIVSQARGRRIAAIDERSERHRWANAATQAGLPFSDVFLEREWHQVILAQDLHTEQAYLTCLRTGRGMPLGKTERGQVWQLVERVTSELAAAGLSTHTQLANEATRILRESGRTLYRHVIVDESQDLHPAQWRLLRAAVAAGSNDMFIAGDPHQRIYDNRVSLTSLGIAIRGRSRRLTVNYRTTQEILAWAVPLLGSGSVTGLDDETDSLIGYRSPVHGQKPEVQGATSRQEELRFLTQRIRSWLDSGIEPHAIGVAARASYLANQARAALTGAGIPAGKTGAKSAVRQVQVGTMHGMKGLEFQAVAVIGVEDGLAPLPVAVTDKDTDEVAHAQDLLRERCVLFVACTRARDHLYVSYTGEPSQFLPKP